MIVITCIKKANVETDCQLKHGQENVTKRSEHLCIKLKKTKGRKSHRSGFIFENDFLKNLQCDSKKAKMHRICITQFLIKEVRLHGNS